MLLAVRRPVVVSLLALAGLTALIAPAVPALFHFGTLPHTAQAPINIVVAGMDVEYNWSAPTWPYPAEPLNYDKSRTDTLMLAQIKPSGEINLLSIPRDTWVNMDGYGWGKINSANRHGAELSREPDAGPRLLMNTVGQLTGVRVDGYLFTSLEAVHDLTDAAGGVTLDVPERMKYDDNAGSLHIDLQPGRQHLNGAQAEGFLRFRHDSLGDIGRVARQQAFMTALSSKLRSPLNWWRLPGVVGALDRNTKTNLTRSQVGALLGAALHGPRISAHTVPGSFGAGGTWMADRAALNSVMRQFFRDPGDPRNLNISVVNIDAPAGSARRLQEQLQAQGYGSVNVAHEDRHAAATTTIAGTGAAQLQQQLGYGAVSSETPTAGADVTIRLGSDTPGQ